jgi:hypothetical protein
MQRVAKDRKLRFANRRMNPVEQRICCHMQPRKHPPVNAKDDMHYSVSLILETALTAGALQE